MSLGGRPSARRPKSDRELLTEYIDSDQRRRAVMEADRLRGELALRDTRRPGAPLWSRDSRRNAKQYGRVEPNTRTTRETHEKG